MKTTKITKTFISKIIKPVDAKTHKGIQGHALLIGGSYGKMGSIALATKAALKSGCGLATAFVPECGCNILQISVPEAMVIADAKYKSISKIKFNIIPQAIGIGPGMGTKTGTQKALHKFLKKNLIPLVIDADALNILSENKAWLPLLPKNSILTPHPKELQRLIGSFDSETEILAETIGFSKLHEVIVVQKGAPTRIISGDSVFENTTGNAALATAGSGDTLTGILTGLLAQSYDPLAAAQLGVYLHGLTADVALSITGMQSFVASDIIGNLGKAWREISVK